MLTLNNAVHPDRFYTVPAHVHCLLQGYEGRCVMCERCIVSDREG